MDALTNMLGKVALILALLAISVGYYYSRSSEQLETITVTCKSGSVRGFSGKSRDGRDFYSWLGIPYAQPPVKELRFAVSHFEEYFTTLFSTVYTLKLTGPSARPPVGWH